MHSILKSKIESRSATIGIIGLGYVGLPLLIEFVRKGFPVIGYDNDPRKVCTLKEGKTYIKHIPDKTIKEINATDRFIATTDEHRIKEMDAILICVPTPLTPQREPDMTFVTSSCELIARNLKQGQLIVLESTTYPGTTDELMKGILENTGLKANKDFMLAYSPEREDPNNPEFSTGTIPKVVGCDCPEGLETTKALYESIVVKVVPVSSTRAAEATKLVENIYRGVNIALVNELKMLFTEMDIDVWEVIDAAATKPFGFTPFYPGPGLGGHCLLGDELVWVNNCTKSHLLSLKELFSKETTSSQIRIKNDIQYVRPEELSINSIDSSSGEQSLKPITHIFKRDYDGPIVSITTNDNRTISVTDRHPMLRVNGDSLEIVEAKRLARGDMLPLFLHRKDAKRDSARKLSIDLIDELDDSWGTRVRVKIIEGTWKDYKQAIYKTVKGDRKYDYTKDDAIPLCLFKKLESAGEIKVDHRDVQLFTGRGAAVNSFPAVVDIDESWARLIGYYLSEGCATKERGFHRIRITINREETELLDDIKSIVAEKGLSCSDSLSPRWKTRYIRLNSPLLGWVLVERLKCGNDSYSMNIPPEIMALGENVKVSLLMGLFRGDGDVYIRSGMRTYKKKGKKYTHHHNSLTAGYFSISKVLFHQVLYVLQEMGICPTIKKGKQRLLINGYDQISRLTNWFIDDKGKKVEKYLNSARRKIGKRQKRGPIPAVSVKEIKISCSCEPVYSIEVADNHTFAASHGIYVHNCIPCDPFYLTWKAREYDMPTKFIELAGEINTHMPRYVVSRVSHALNEHHKALKKAKILLLGIAYKKDVDDMRESPSLKLIELLEERGATVDFHDPYIPVIPETRDHSELAGRKGASLDELETYDCVLIATDHTDISYSEIARRAKLVVDTRHALKGNGYANLVRA